VAAGGWACRVFQLNTLPGQNGISSFLQAEFDQHLAVQGLFQHTFDPAILDPFEQVLPMALFAGGFCFFGGETAYGRITNGK